MKFKLNLFGKEIVISITIDNYVCFNGKNTKITKEKLVTVIKKRGKIAAIKIIKENTNENLKDCLIFVNNFIYENMVPYFISKEYLINLLENKNYIKALHTLNENYLCMNSGDADKFLNEFMAENNIIYIRS